jgi:hypothetical protein
MPTGENYKPERQKELADFRQHVADLHNIPLDELADAFDFRDVRELSDYQMSATAEELADMPYTEGFTAKYGEDAAMLGDNTSAYDNIEGLEDDMVSDAVIAKIRAARKNNPNSKELATATRVRRSTIFIILKTMSQPICDVIEMPQSGLSQDIADISGTGA